MSQRTLTHPLCRPLTISLCAATAAGILLAFATVPALADLVDAYFPPGIIGPDTRIGVTVATRVRPATDPLGVRAGAFTIRPQVGIATGYDSNALFARGGKGSVLVQTTGQVAVSSNWSRDPLGALVTFEDNRLLAASRQSTTNWTAAIAQGIDIGRDRLTISATHLALHQTARDLNAPRLDAPGAYSVDNIRLVYAADRGPFHFEPQLQYTAYRYTDVTNAGVGVAQGFRDRDVLDAQLTTKFGYALLRDVAVVLRGASIAYLHAQPGLKKPDATTVSVLAGIDHASSAVWRYRLLAGVQARQSASPQIRNKVAPIAEASVIWMPSGLTTYGLALTRGLQDSAGEFAAAYAYTEARLSVDHELTRDLLLHGHVAVQRAEYEHSSATETLATANASATWLMNRKLRMIGSYTYLTKQTATGGAISESVAMIRLQVGL
jgi:hypothetical protein